MIYKIFVNEIPFADAYLRELEQSSSLLFFKNLNFIIITIL